MPSHRDISSYRILSLSRLRLTFALEETLARPPRRSSLTLWKNRKNRL